LLAGAQPQSLAQGGYAAAGGDAALSCEQLAAELMVSVGGVMGTAGEQLRIAQDQQPDMVGEAVTNQILGMVGGGLPLVGSLVGAVESGREARRRQEAEAAAAREQLLQVQQEVRIDRLQRLHEMHEQRCATRQAR
jgi:hypothetical protein